MSATSAREILARLEAGEDPEALVATLLPGDIQTALKYAAPLRWLTSELWDELRGTLTDPDMPRTVTLDDLVRRDLVRELPRERGRFVMAEETRATYVGRWDTEELTRYSATLAKVFTSDAYERLYHLMLADERAAVALFERLFAEADDRFDLTAARSLLDLFERPDRRQIVDDELGARLAGWRAQLDARTASTTDYYRSAGFLDRPKYRDLLEDLLAGEKFRALQLVAMGGMGKTMLLRSFIARRCIPNRIFVARIDFDDIEPAIAAKYPWLIRISLAQQLDEQSPVRPFDSLLSERRRFLPALFRDAGRETTAALRELATLGETDWLALEVTARYEDGMDRLVESGSPVVLVFDTLEVPVLRSDLDAGPLVDTLLGTGRRSEARLLLAGRYDLQGRADLGSTALRTESLDAFTEAEARSYLSDVRGIDRSEIVDAIVAKHDLMPFTLALYGDLANRAPDLTVADLAAAEGPKQLYLIERVLERIDDRAVLYALRYGVVARRFDKRFLRDVLIGHVEAALRRQHIDDDPDLDRNERIKARFQIDDPAAYKVGVDELWRRLTLYAASQSWISFVADSEEYLSFHPNVREPMRLVVKEQKWLRRLHATSYGYFRDLMTEQPHRLVQWAEEAAYHLFHARGPDGDPQWRSLLAAVEELAGPRERGDVAAALTTDQDLTADGGMSPARWFGGQSVMSVKTLAEAHLEVALARLSEPGYFAGLAWSQVELQLSTVEAMEQQAGRALVDDERRSVVRVALEARDGRRGALDAALAHMARTGDPALIDALAGIVMSHAGSIGPRRLARLVDARRTMPESAGVIRSMVASLLLVEGDAIGAAAHASAAVGSVEEEELADFRVWLALARGAPTEAARLLAGRPVTAPVVIRQGRALLVAQQPEAALEACRRLAGSATSSDGRLTVHLEASRLAVVAELEGRVSAAWGETDAAVRSLDEAALRWRDAGDLVREADVRAATARILLDEGRVLEAGRHLSAAAQVRVPAGHDLAIFIQLLRCRWLDRGGNGVEAGQVLDDLLSSLATQPRGPVALACAALQGLSLAGGAKRQRYVGLLADAVGRFRPPDAALPALDGIDRCDPIAATELPDGEWGDSSGTNLPEGRPGPLDRLLQAATWPRAGYGTEDAALRALRLAEVARVLGEPERARACVERVASVRFDADSLIRLRTLEAAARLGLPFHGLEPMAVGFAERHSSSRPALALDAFIAWAKASNDTRWMRYTDQMLALLEQAGGPSRRNAEVLLLRARAVGSGHAADDPGELVAFADQLYRSLGDEAGSRSVKTVVKPSAEPPRVGSGPSWRRAPDVLDVHVYDEDGMLAVESSATRWTQRSLLVAPQWQAGSTWLRSDVDELVDELRPPLVQLAAGRQDCRLRIVSPQLAELPWELAWPEKAPEIMYRAALDGGVRRVMRVQRALAESGYHLVVDGVIGPQTQRAIDAYQAAKTGEAGGDIESSLLDEGPDPTALILQLSHEVRVQKGRSRSRPVARDYEGADFETVVIDDPTSRAVSRLSYPCSVVHVQASLESLGGSAGLSFDSGKSVRHSSEYGLEVLTVTALHDLLMRITTSLGPVVVLEAVAPPSRLEVLRQVLLRNLFASQLFELGYASAVLAIGPVPYGAEDLLPELVAPTLAGRLAGISDLGQLYRRMLHSRWQPLLRQQLAIPALFAEDPAAVRLT